MIIYRHEEQLGVIYDSESTELVPREAEIVKVLESTQEDIESVMRVSLGDLEKTLGMYL